MKIRLIDSGAMCGFYNMALDEAVLKLRAEEKSPDTLRFYRWDVPTVSMGYFQKIHNEIDVEYCKQKGYKVVRRPTGGRAVFHNDELTYSFITGKGNPLILKDVIESYKLISKGLLEGLNLIGIPVITSNKGGELKAVDSSACFDTPSWYEIVINNKKLIGSAQTRIKEGLLQHGSLLMSLGIKETVRTLNLPEEKREKVEKILLRKATSLELEGFNYTYDDLKDAIAEGFAKSFDCEVYWGDFTDEEKKLAHELYKDKYSTDEWNYKK